MAPTRAEDATLDVAEPDRATEPAGEPSERVAVVLSGASARGAFQAGALAVLIPALQAQGLRPTIWLGTSAGAINATLWSAFLHEGAEAAAERVVDIWRRMSDDDVYRPLTLTGPRSALQFALGALLQRGPGTTSVVNTAPLQRTADAELPVEQLHRNVADGIVEAVGVVATRVPNDTDAATVGAASGRSVLFLDTTTPTGYTGDPQRALDVVPGPLRAEHVVASSAIPVAFPSIRIDEPAGAAAWYVDGGVRLNAPLQPAIGLGASRVLLVSATATTVAPPPPAAPAGPEPDIADTGAQVLHAALADRTTEDLITLQRVNRVVGQSPVPLVSPSGRTYRHVPVMAVSPPPGELGQVADQVWGEQVDRRLGWLRETDNWLLGRGLRGLGNSVGRRELLSYVFFDPDYFARSIERGRAAAERALAGGWTG